MHYLGLALYAEGPTDYHFLRPLLQRLCEDICTRNARGMVDISEVLALNHPACANAEPRENRILAAARAARGAWNILFVHADGAGHPERARSEQVEPAFAALKRDFSAAEFGVAVIPVRETEAWTILDGDALRRVFGTRLSDQQLGLPAAPHAAEATSDPKATLDHAFRKARTTRRRTSVSPYLNALGEQVALDRLRAAEAFARLEADLTTALQTLGLLR